MPHLTCPRCDRKLSVAVSQAGTEVSCPDCQQVIPVPKLGELRRLATETAPEGRPLEQAPGVPLTERDTGRRLAFAALMAIAGTVAIIGVFCLFRYLTIEVPYSTEAHIENVEQMYRQVSAAQLVREWQELEKFGLDVATPYQYKKIEQEKSRWARNGLICSAVVATALLGAVVLGVTDSRRPA